MTSKEKRDALLYNLRPGDRERIAAYQGGIDPITGAPLVEAFNIDHHHGSGLVRGALNPWTNKTLIDDQKILVKMLKYLENPPAVAALGEPVYGLIGRAKRKKKMLYGPDGRPTPAARKGTLEVPSLPDVHVQPRRKRQPRSRRADTKVGWS